MPVVYFAFIRLQTTVISPFLEILPVKKTRVQPHNKEKVPLQVGGDQRKKNSEETGPPKMQTAIARLEVPEESTFVSNLSCK